MTHNNTCRATYDNEKEHICVLELNHRGPHVCANEHHSLVWDFREECGR